MGHPFLSGPPLNAILNTRSTLRIGLTSLVTKRSVSPALGLGFPEIQSLVVRSKKSHFN